MDKKREYTTVYLIGATAYGAIEILWRGFTHWTMCLTGGLCFLSFHIFNIKNKSRKLIEKCAVGSGIITAIEFIVGCTVNKLLNWHVWDYSNVKGNILGQICPIYSIFWFLLCIPMTFISNKLNIVKRTAE